VLPPIIVIAPYSKSRVRWRPTRHSINRAGDGLTLIKLALRKLWSLAWPEANKWG
jgi:hypothetical protein